VNDFERVTQTPYKEKPRTPNGYAAQFYQFERKANTDPSLFHEKQRDGTHQRSLQKGRTVTLISKPDSDKSTKRKMWASFCGRQRCRNPQRCGEEGKK
jgi:hypothetical protein